MGISKIDCKVEYMLLTCELHKLISGCWVWCNKENPSICRGIVKTSSGARLAVSEKDWLLSATLCNVVANGSNISSDLINLHLQVC